jgi:hypothetical protein
MRQDSSWQTKQPFQLEQEIERLKATEKNQSLQTSAFESSFKLTAQVMKSEVEDDLLG